MAHAPYENARKYTRQLQKHTQQVHKKAMETRNTIHKPSTKHTRETHTQKYAETHAIGSQRVMNILKEIHKHTASS